MTTIQEIGLAISKKALGLHILAQCFSEDMTLKELILEPRLDRFNEELAANSFSPLLRGQVTSYDGEPIMKREKEI